MSTMSDSDNPSSPKKEEMDVSENGDASKTKDDSEDDSKAKESPKKESPKKESSKKETPKKEKKEEVDDESEDDDDDEEPPLGLLERPVELTSGKREKKKVERLEVNINMYGADRNKKMDIPEGKGTKLGECPRIEFKLSHTKAMDLKPLHRLLFNRAGSNMEVKKNIRQFSGFTFAKGDKEFEKRVTSLNKNTLPQLKHVCEVLDIERGGTKSAIIDRIMEFLLKPSSSGLEVPEKKKRKSKGGGDTEKKGAKRKRAPKKTEKKSKPSKDMTSDLSDSDDIEDEEEEEEIKSESASEEVEEEEEEEPPKKKAKTEKKPAAKKETAKKETPKAKKQNGKQEKAAKAEKKEPKKKKVADSDDSDSDDEPLAPKKSEPPNNSELKDVIKKILDGANLEEVTMKTVVKQVYEKYPSFDLTDRKDFIKTTVREIIS